MTDELRARLSARIAAYLEANPLRGRALRLVAMEPIERGVRAHFATDRPMSHADLSIAEAVNAALREAIAGDADARGQRVEVRVEVEA